MKRFFYKLFLYIVILGVLVSTYLSIVYFNPDYVDYYYYRFTTDRATSLILGGSRAAQGLKPEVINAKVCNENNEIINHAFALGPGNFGPNYYKEIQQKLKPDSKNGVFIMSVVPWNFSTDTSNIVDDSLEFFEHKRNLFVGTLSSSSTNPNLEYLWHHWNDKFSVFENAVKHIINYGRTIQLHEDGWLEVSINMDSVSVNNRIRNSTNGYIHESNRYIWSETRYHYFEKMVKYCLKRGNVYLVRMPVSPQMAELEYQKFPFFDEKILYVADKYNIPYFNFMGKSGEYLTIDTHHLWKEESERISIELCDSINTHLSNKALDYSMR